MYTPSRQFGSSADTRILRMSHITTETLGSEARNSLPSDIHHIQSSHAFKAALLILLLQAIAQVSPDSVFLLAFPIYPSPPSAQPPPPQPPSLHYFKSVCPCVCVCVRTRERESQEYYIYIYIIVDLVKRGVPIKQ